MTETISVPMQELDNNVNTVGQNPIIEGDGSVTQTPVSEFSEPVFSGAAEIQPANLDQEQINKSGARNPNLKSKIREYVDTWLKPYTHSSAANIEESGQPESVTYSAANPTAQPNEIAGTFHNRGIYYDDSGLRPDLDPDLVRVSHLIQRAKETGDEKLADRAVLDLVEKCPEKALFYARNDPTSSIARAIRTTLGGPAQIGEEQAEQKQSLSIKEEMAYRKSGVYIDFQGNIVPEKDPLLLQLKSEIEEEAIRKAGIKDGEEISQEKRFLMDEYTKGRWDSYVRMNGYRAGAYASVNSPLGQEIYSAQDRVKRQRKAVEERQGGTEGIHTQTSFAEKESERWVDLEKAVKAEGKTIPDYLSEKMLFIKLQMETAGNKDMAKDIQLILDLLNQVREERMKIEDVLILTGKVSKKLLVEKGFDGKLLEKLDPRDLTLELINEYLQVKG